jgi:hypothetical protein
MPPDALIPRRTISEFVPQIWHLMRIMTTAALLAVVGGRAESLRILF